MQRDLDLLGGAGALVAEQVAERGVALGADRPVEARDRARDVGHRRDLLERQLGLGGDLLVGRVAAELASASVRRVRWILRSRWAMFVGTRIVRALFSIPRWIGLADPVRRVGRELEAAAPVELLGRADQAEDPLLDEVEQRQLVLRVALGDRDDEREVGVDHPLLGLRVALLDALGELDLLLGGQQRVAADLVEEQAQRVGRRDRQAAVAVVRRAGTLLRPQSSVTSIPRASKASCSSQQIVVGARRAGARSGRARRG